ncbi:TonB family protein [Jiulongibacter sediminis]|nr:TonB family protein [Jiulongibacter sediminis]TBX27064.1 hypothetical protein TK44_05690 [Jiulongibacter sediminis]
MMRYLIFVLTLASFFSKAQSPVLYIEGTVYGHDQEPIPGASININGSSEKTTTDANGRFEYASTYEIDEISISSIDHKSLVMKDKLGHLPLEIHLELENQKGQYPAWFIADSTDYKRADFEEKKELLQFKLVKTSARYPGDIFEMERFMRIIMTYPPEGLANQIEGQVDVEFIINTEGRAENPRIVKSLGEAFDQQVLKFVNAMPRWSVAEQNGYKVSDMKTITVEFKLKEF